MLERRETSGKGSAPSVSCGEPSRLPSFRYPPAEFRANISLARSWNRSHDYRLAGSKALGCLGPSRRPLGRTPATGLEASTGPASCGRHRPQPIAGSSGAGGCCSCGGTGCAWVYGRTRGARRAAPNRHDKSPRRSCTGRTRTSIEGSLGHPTTSILMSAGLSTWPT